MIKEKNVIVIDVDGTLTLKNIHFDGYENVSVSNLMKNKLIQLKSKGYWIILYTSRNMRTHNGNVGLIIKNTAPTLIKWLDDNDVPYDELHFGKPWCGHDGFYVDDRAIRPKEFVECTIDELEAIVDRDKSIE